MADEKLEVAQTSALGGEVEVPESTPKKRLGIRAFFEANAVFFGSVAALTAVVAAITPAILILAPKDEEADQQARQLAASAPYLSAEITGMPPRLRIHNHGLGTAFIRSIIFTDPEGNLLLDSSNVPTTEDEDNLVQQRIQDVHRLLDRLDELDALGLPDIPVGSVFTPSGQTITIPVGGSATIYEVLNIEQVDDMASERGQQAAFLEWVNSFSNRTKVQIAVVYSGMNGGCYILQFGSTSTICENANDSGT